MSSKKSIQSISSKISLTSNNNLTTSNQPSTKKLKSSSTPSDQSPPQSTNIQRKINNQPTNYPTTNNQKANNVIQQSKTNNIQFQTNSNSSVQFKISDNINLDVSLKTLKLKPSNTLKCFQNKSDDPEIIPIPANYQSITKDINHLRLCLFLGAQKATQKEREIFIIFDTMINNGYIEALLDSGASHCYMSESTFNHINDLDNPLEILEVNTSVILADGSTVICHGAVEIPVRINDLLFKIIYFIVPTLSFETILGMNFINKHVVYDGPNKQVTFVRAQHQEKFQLINKDEFIIPAFHSTLITMVPC